MSDDDRRRRAVENLARDMVKHGGISSEKAHREAAKIAREADKKQQREQSKESSK